MAYPNQDFGEAAPPDSGGHLGGHTRPDQLFDGKRMDAAFAPRPAAGAASAPPRPGVSAGAVAFSLFILLALLLVPSFIW